MLSRDAMHQLIAKDGLLEIFNRPEADLMWRYPGWLSGSNEEHLFNHYLRFVSVYYDESTGISTLQVQAFRPADAQKIAAALLRYSEALVNKLTERAQGDAIQTALREVGLSKTKAFAAQEKITAFRNRESIVDPTRASASVLENIARLLLETAQTNAQLAELLKSSPLNPQISSLRLRIAALEEQIQKERLQLAGNNSSLAPLIAEYEHLMLEREFAERTFMSAQNTYEAARADAQRQRLYLEQISNAALPDYPAYPYRFVFIVAVFLVSSIIYRIIRSFVLDAMMHAFR
jgi:capsular polysaccharide transport system permease protein